MRSRGTVGLFGIASLGAALFTAIGAFAMLFSLSSPALPPTPVVIGAVDGVCGHLKARSVSLGRPKTTRVRDRGDVQPLTRFPSHAPHPSFWVSIKPSSIRAMGWHWERENLTYALMREIIIGAEETKKGSSLMLDVGSNHGFFALYAAAAGAGKVIAVEPQKRLGELIRASTEANGFSDILTVRRNAVALERTQVIMNRTRGDGGVAFAVYADGKQTDEDAVDAIPLMDILSGLPSVDFMKIDIEGFEAVALRSAFPAIRKQQIRNFVVEFGPPNRLAVAMKSGPSPRSQEARLAGRIESLEILKKIAASGYALFVIPGWCSRDYVKLESSPPVLGARIGCLEIPVMPVDNSFLRWFVTEMRHECMLWWTLDPPPLAPLSPKWDEIATGPLT
eukprot:Hpha_TRINITY_DN27675_c0_g1::TRINITY_DN27675_c0_g1_i1::g.57366::m.57366